MATDLEHRIKRLEEKCPAPPCGHSLGILIDPTEEEVEALHKQIEECPRCDKPGGRPRVVIIFHNFRELEEEPNPAVQSLDFEVEEETAKKGNHKINFTTY